MNPIALTTEAAAALDAPHLVHAADASGAYLGVVERAPGVIATGSAPPADDSRTWRWSAADGRWIGAETLETLRAAAWERAKAARAAAICAPVVTAWGTFDADELSRANITQAVQFLAARQQAGEVDPTVDWTLADNTAATIGLQALTEVALALAQQIQAAYARGRELRDAIEAATDAAALEALAW